MFELSVALKYLTPRWRQLSVSIISLISIFVIALVVWLIVVFFSVTNGLEKSWISKLTALTAPLRITPTDTYYNSYYYLVDSISQDSDYSLKTLEEKWKAEKSDPYNKESDEEIPLSWPKPDLNSKGELKDPVKVAFHAIENLKETIADIQASDFEMTFANMHLQLVRNASPHQFEQSILNQNVTLGSFDSQNINLQKSLLKPLVSDLSNYYQMLGVGGDFLQEENDLIELVDKETLQKRLLEYFSKYQITELETPFLWVIPKSLYPKSGRLKAEQMGKYLVISPSKKGSVTLDFKEGVSDDLLIATDGGVKIKALLKEDSLKTANRPKDVEFTLSFYLQGVLWEGIAPLGSLLIHHVVKTEESFSLPEEGVLLPRNFREAGIMQGDRGYLSYFAPTTSTIQEQRVPIFIAGFYDPGVIPVGGKYIIANKEVVSTVRSSQAQEGHLLSNGINVRFADFEAAPLVKERLQKAFEEANIAPYFRLETFREFEFTKDILQQLKSEKHLFTLLATIIIIVACSNIISMLIILVNDKKVEIGILRSMGATSSSIALIFGLCGVVMGFLGSFIGILAAILTLHNLQPVINFLSLLQGHEMFNPQFFGDSLPTDLSVEALLFVIISTGLISLVAGLVPALKACFLRPSTILRSE